MSAQIDNIIVHDEQNIKGFFYEYRWLSNYHPCVILWHNLPFKNTEAAYQASKCTNIEAAKVFVDMDGLAAKKHSKTFQTTKTWHNRKLDIMAQLVFQKFLVNLELRTKLLETGDKYIEETNYWNDTFWGVCNGVGENNLGKLLMATREYFKTL